MDYYNAQQFGNRVKDLRRKKGLTQKELAVQAEIPLSVIIKSERGKLIRGNKTVLKLAIFFKVTTDYLLMG